MTSLLEDLVLAWCAVDFTAAAALEVMAFAGVEV